MTQTNTQTLLEYAETLEGNAGAVMIELLQCVTNVANKAIYSVSEDNVVSDAKVEDYEFYAQQALAKAAALVKGD